MNAIIYLLLRLTRDAFLRRVIPLLLGTLAAGASAYEDHWNTATGGKPSRNGLVWERGPASTNVLWSGGLYSVDGFPPVMEGNTVVMSRLAVATSDPVQMQHSATIVAHNLTSSSAMLALRMVPSSPSTPT